MAGRDPLTPEDLELLVTPSKEIEARHRSFCFERDKFETRICGGERWQQLLQAHLYFDHVVTQILLDALPDPDSINVRRIGFAQKLQFVSAMALLPEELIAPIEFINGLRNKIAHVLDFEIADAAVVDLANCTPKWIREIAETEDGRSAGPLLFREILRIALFQAEVCRQRAQVNRVLARKSTLRLGAVLGGLKVPIIE